MAFKFPSGRKLAQNLGPEAIGGAFGNIEKIAKKFKGYEGSRAEIEFQRAQREFTSLATKIIAAAVAVELVAAVVEAPLMLIGVGEITELATPIAIGIGTFLYLKEKKASIRANVSREAEILWPAQNPLPSQAGRARLEPYRLETPVAQTIEGTVQPHRGQQPQPESQPPKFPPP